MIFVPRRQAGSSNVAESLFRTIAPLVAAGERRCREAFGDARLDLALDPPIEAARGGGLPAATCDAGAFRSGRAGARSGRAGCGISRSSETHALHAASLSPIPSPAELAFAPGC